MTNYSKNKKLNFVLNEIELSLIDFGIDEIKRYIKEFKYEPDYNIAQFGNLLIYYSDIRDLYTKAGYTTHNRYSDNQVWLIYKRQVGFVARKLTGAIAI